MGVGSAVGKGVRQILSGGWFLDPQRGGRLHPSEGERGGIKGNILKIS